MPNFTYYKDKMKPTNTYIPMLIKAFNIIVFTIVWVSVGALTLPFYLAYILIKWRWDKPNKSHKHDNYQSQIDSNLRFMNKKYDTLKQDTAREINELLITIGQLSEQLERVKDKQFKDANDINELEADVELNKKLGKLASEDRINNRLDAIDKRFKGVNRNINELQLSLENMKPIDLGAIKAEALGMQVAREEYDWHREQKAKDKQIQDRMRKDEAEFLND